MTPLIICAIFSAMCTLYLIAPIAHSHMRTCYVLMVFIPVASLSIYMKVGSPALPSKPALFEQNTDRGTAREKFHVERKEEVFLLQQLAKNEEGQKVDPTLILQLSGLYIDQDRLDEAIELLSEALEKHGGNKDLELQLATAYFSKGLLHADKNENKKSMELLQMAYNLSPPNAPFLADLRNFIRQIKSEIEDKSEGE